MSKKSPSSLGREAKRISDYVDGLEDSRWDSLSTDGDQPGLYWARDFSPSQVVVRTIQDEDPFGESLSSIITSILRLKRSFERDDDVDKE